MKIIVLMASPNKNGSTSLLTNEFVKGVADAGHDVLVYDVAHANISACGGCTKKSWYHWNWLVVLVRY